MPQHDPVTRLNAFRRRSGKDAVQLTATAGVPAVEVVDDFYPRMRMHSCTSRNSLRIRAGMLHMRASPMLVAQELACSASGKQADHDQSPLFSSHSLSCYTERQTRIMGVQKVKLTGREEAAKATCAGNTTACDQASSFRSSLPRV